MGYITRHCCEILCNGHPIGLLPHFRTCMLLEIACSTCIRTCLSFASSTSCLAAAIDTYPPCPMSHVHRRSIRAPRPADPSCLPSRQQPDIPA